MKSIKKKLLYLLMLFLFSSPFFTQAKCKTKKIKNSVTVKKLLKACDLLVCGNASICGDLVIKGATFGNVTPGAAQFGNVIRVDQVLGDNATGVRNGQPFATISAGLLAALPGDMVWVFPGTYTETITIPDNVSLVGVNEQLVTIQKLHVTDHTNLVTMGENSSLESITLLLHSVQHYQLSGIVFPGTTSKTANIKHVDITVDNSSASVAGNSNVYGIISDGAGIPEKDEIAVFDTSIKINSVGTGAKRGILVNTTNGLVVNNSNILATNAGGAGTYIGAETSDATGFLTLSCCTASGSTADISQSLGTLTLDNTDLVNSNANGFGFGLTTYPSNLIFADNGTLPGGITYMKPGTYPPDGDEIFIQLSQKIVVKAISVRCRLAPSTIDTWTVRKNGVDTPLTVTLSSGQFFAKNDSISVTFNETDSLSLKLVSGSSGASDITVVLDIY